MLSIYKYLEDSCERLFPPATSPLAVSPMCYVILFTETKPITDIPTRTRTRPSYVRLYVGQRIVFV